MDILIHTTGESLYSFLTPTVVGGRRPFSLKFALSGPHSSAYYVSILTDSENVHRQSSNIPLPSLAVHRYWCET